MLANSDQHYGLVSKSLHWLIALIILTLIGVGLYMADLDKEDPGRLQIYGLHKAMGVAVFGLAVLRIAWIKFSAAPVLPAAIEGWQRALSKAVKVLLYILMLLTPAAGYLMSNAAGKPVVFFGLYEMPAIVGQSKALAGVFREVHEILAFAMLALIILHVAGALKHRLIDKDPAVDVLRRML